MPLFHSLHLTMSTSHPLHNLKNTWLIKFFPSAYSTFQIEKLWKMLTSANVLFLFTSDFILSSLSISDELGMPSKWLFFLVYFSHTNDCFFLFILVTQGQLLLHNTTVLYLIVYSNAFNCSFNLACIVHRIETILVWNIVKYKYFIIIIIIIILCNDGQSILFSGL